jgi:hypothetical protein
MDAGSTDTRSPTTGWLDPACAQRWLTQALDNVEREFPNKPDHVLERAGEDGRPRTLHPAFYGSFDWHSSVHQHWLIVTLLSRHPTLAGADRAHELLARHLCTAAIAGELVYLGKAHAATFERPYGWAWLLALDQAVAASPLPAARRWSEALRPLARACARRFRDYLPRLDYPVRHGVHTNTAFALLLARRWCAATREHELGALIDTRARHWFESDRDATAAARFEPSGSDFLSPVLVEAALMRRILGEGFPAWLDRFLPGLDAGQPASLLAPATVSDRADPQIVHLDGLNLSRAWCWQSIADGLADGDGRRALARAAASAHRVAGWKGLDSAEYVGAHWLTTYAALAAGA